MRRKLNIIRDKGVDDIPTFKCRSNRRLKSLKYLERPTRVSDLIRLGTTSDIDLRKIAKSLGIPNLRVDWGSAAPKNFEDIPSIFNIGDGVGTHWIATYGNNYFDPVGLPPDIQFLNYQWSPIQVQALESKFCGQYCLLWLYYAIRDDIPGFYAEFDMLNSLPR